MLGLFLFALGTGLWLNLRPLYLADLGATPKQIGFALALSSFSAGILPLPAGIISDRIGPRRVILFSWTVALLGAVFIATAQSWQMVTVGMLIYSLTWAANPAVTSYVMLSMPEDLNGVHLEKAFSWVFRAWPMAMIFAPALGGWIADAFSIQTDVWISVFTFMLAIIIFWPADEFKVKKQSKAIRFGPLVKNKNYLILVGFFGLLMIAQQIGYALVPNFLKEVRGFDQSGIGFLFSISFAGTFAFNIILEKVRPRKGFLLLMVFPWIAMVFIWLFASPFWVWLAFFLLGGTTAMWLIKMASVGRVVSKDIQGLAFGLVESVGFLSLSAASGVAGILYAATSAHNLPLIASVISMPLVFLLWLLYVLRTTGEPPK
jgi:MFS family permease